MVGATAVLFGIEDEFGVVSVDRSGSRSGAGHHRDAVAGGGVPGLWSAVSPGLGPAVVSD